MSDFFLHTLELIILRVFVSVSVLNSVQSVGRLQSVADIVRPRKATVERCRFTQSYWKIGSDCFDPIQLISRLIRPEVEYISVLPMRGLTFDIFVVRSICGFQR
jgi:hypothetical protein